MVASVQQLFTRDRRPFVSAVLEDLDGRVEVMVWPKVYASTRDLWNEGNILVVEGKVRLREDRVQLNCDYVRHYQPTPAEGEEPVSPHLSQAPIVIEETTVDTAPAETRRLLISVRQTTDADNDAAYLHRLIDILKEFPGQDEVSLCISNEEKVTNLKLPNASNYCPELHQRLVELVGEDGLKVESSE